MTRSKILVTFYQVALQKEHIPFYRPTSVARKVPVPHPLVNTGYYHFLEMY